MSNVTKNSVYSYKGCLAHNSLTLDFSSSSLTFSLHKASLIIPAILIMSSLSNPLVVTAAVPILIPDITNGLL